MPIASGGLGKISELGIKVSRHCNYRSVCLNVAMDLSAFQRINLYSHAGLKAIDLSTIGFQTNWGEAVDQLTSRRSPAKRVAPTAAGVKSCKEDLDDAKNSCQSPGSL